MTVPLLELRDIGQTREGRDILKGVNLRIERGEVFALIGSTGAGKTTLLRIINLLDSPSRGELLYDGTDTTSSDKFRLESRRRMAFVLQKPVVFNSSVYDNVAYGLKWRGIPKQQVREKVNEMLDITGLTEFRGRNARTLSGGEMQRVAIARAVATDPELLLLDEPTANLDPVSATRIEDILTGIIKRKTITVVMATHDMAQGQKLADRIGVLDDGELVQTGTPGDIFTHPRSRDVAEFVGMENLFEGIIASCEREMAVIDVNGTMIEAVTDCDVGEEVSVGIRPEDVTIALSRISSSARNSLAGTITWTVLNGPLCRVEMDCGFPLVALVTKRSAEEMGLVKGTRVYATFKAVSLHIMRRR
jgi:tungstate transport system ATP-binding protein